MNPVIGLDIAKGESEGQAFLDKSKPYGRSFSMEHTRVELAQFLNLVKEIQAITEEVPVVILESTGHYHTPVIQWLVENEVPYVLLNPIISYQAKKSSLRKVKTDAFDAYQLGVLYYKEEFEPHKMRGLKLLNLRNLSRQQEIVSNMYVEAKLHFHTILDQVFPMYRGVFGDLFSKVSLTVLKEFQTSLRILSTDEQQLSEYIKLIVQVALLSGQQIELRSYVRPHYRIHLIALCIRKPRNTKRTFYPGFYWIYVRVQLPF
ncbi:IS110 family transposase [Cytobacillus purgationiresistens]|uniref:Transposase IS110-like N-terminal domain-containing protein n=1 Tax=Cytobacillus purgationiresistens TaxID=863449 RepID=A0ABU0AJK0_9BACI|nr:transposase [Cytobacillus purgationiresistens]MDQ0271450.1 hypothetical protein [Cytobacillus purgationiresistens]